MGTSRASQGHGHCGEAWTGAQGGARPEELLACSALSGAQLCAEEAGKVWAVRGVDGGPADLGIPGPPFLYCSELWEMTILLSAKLDIIPVPRSSLNENCLHFRTQGEGLKAFLASGQRPWLPSGGGG